MPNRIGCIDRVLPRDLMRVHSRLKPRSGVARAISPIGKLWMNGSTIRVKFIGGTREQRSIAKEQAGWWSEHANLRFEFTNTRNAEIRVAFDAGGYSWSYTGTDARDIPESDPTMNLGSLEGAIAAHEFGHAIGLVHEHSVLEGPTVWNEEVIIRELAGPPNFWPPEQTRHQIIEKYSRSQIGGQAFDPNSIMVFFFPDDWTIDGTGVKPNEGLSPEDKAFIGSARFYPKPR